MFIPLHDDNRMRYLARPYVNYALIGITVVCFFLTGGFDLHEIDASAVGLGVIPAANGATVAPPQYVPLPATYVTYAFLHVGWLHLIGNMAFLWVFGDNVEDALGHVRYLVFYLATAAGAAYVHVLLNPYSTATLIGASGAVAGVVGAYLMLHPCVKLWILLLGRIPVRLSAMWVLGAWAVFQLFNAFAAAENDTTAWWVHVGGMLVGAALIVVLRRPGVPLFDRNLPEPG